MSAQEPEEPPSFIELGMKVLEDMDPLRSLIRGMVAQYESDGFTPDQARAIVTFQLTGHRVNYDGDDE